MYVLGGDQHGEVSMLATSIQAQHWRASVSCPEVLVFPATVVKLFCQLMTVTMVNGAIRYYF